VQAVAGVGTTIYAASNSGGKYQVLAFDEQAWAWTSLATDVSGQIYALAVQGPGTLVAGTSDGARYYNGSAWNSVSGVAGPVYSFDVQQDGRVYFATASGKVFQTPQGSSIATASAALVGAAINGASVRAVTIAGPTLYAVGSEGASPTVPAVYAWPSPSGSWESLTRSFSGAIYAVAIDEASGDVYVGGSFSGLAGVAAQNLARWSASTQTWETMGVGGPVYALEIAAGYLFVGGSFASPCSNLAVFTLGSLSVGCAVGGGVGGPVRALKKASDESALYVGGSFSHVSGYSAANVAKLTLSGGVLAWQSGFPGLAADGSLGVLALEFFGTTLYAGRKPPAAGGSGLMRLSEDGLGWEVPSQGVSGTVRSLVSKGTDLYLGGSFTVAGGASGFNNVARFDGSTYWDLGGGVTAESGSVAEVSSLAFLTSDQLWVGGAFSAAGSAVAKNLAVYDMLASDPNKVWSSRVAPGVYVSALGSPATSCALCPRLIIGGNQMLAEAWPMVTGRATDMALSRTPDGTVMLAKRNSAGGSTRMDMHLFGASDAGAGESWQRFYSINAPQATTLGPIGLTFSDVGSDSEPKPSYFVYWTEGSTIQQAHIGFDDQGNAKEYDGRVSLGSSQLGRFAVPEELGVSLEAFVMKFGLGGFLEYLTLDD
jgi:hypothetical protein